MVLALAMVIAYMPNLSAPEVSAAELSTLDQMSSIIYYAGNEDIKALGESLVADGPTSVSAQPEGAAAGTRYYVDATGGNDTNSGTSEAEAWQSIEKINNVTAFQPGDEILLKAGSLWQDVTLAPNGSGTEAAPIILGAYGVGPKPKIEGRGQVSDVVYLYNQDFWEIRDLDVSNTEAGFTGYPQNASNGNKLKDIRGIHITGGSSKGTVEGLWLHDLFVHDVTGLVGWIGGSTANNGVGFTFQNGWDKSKRTGGVIFEMLKAETSDTPTIFRNVTVEQNVFVDNSFSSLIIKQWEGNDAANPTKGWASHESGTKPYYNDTNFFPHSNITIQDNYLDHTGSAYACNTIYCTSVEDSLIQRNVSKGSGTCAIELYHTDSVTVQNNEVYGTIIKAGGSDSNAIDPDRCSTNALIQYNYIHETGDGILLCGFNFGSAIVRYNVIKDAEKRFINPHGDKGDNYVYNNILYNTRNVSTVDFVYSSGGTAYHTKDKNLHHFYNNVFYNASNTPTSVRIADGASLYYDKNAYFGKAVNPPTAGVSRDANPITGDPKFAGTAADITGGMGNAVDLSALQLTAASPLIGAGRVVTGHTGLISELDGNGGKDIAGNALNADSVDIGIFKFLSTPDGLGTFSGYVLNAQSVPVAGATVSLTASASLLGIGALSDYSAVTDQNGHFSIDDIPVGFYDVTVSKTGYESATMLNVDIGEEVTQLNLQLGASLSTVGSVLGKVSNASGDIAGVLVTLSAPDETVYTATSAADGSYSITDVPAGTGYSIKAEKDGFTIAVQDNVTIEAGANTTINFTLSTLVPTQYLINEHFNTYAIGDLTTANNAVWRVDGASGTNRSATIVADPDKAGNQYLRLYKNNSSGNLVVANKTAVGVSGIVTIEARVKRTVHSATANQFSFYSANQADYTAGTVGSYPIGTMAMASGNIITHNVQGASTTVVAAPYQLNQWYIVRNVVNLDTNTFDFYVDDMETPKLTNQPLRTQGRATLDFFQLFASTTNYGDFLVDYFRVNTGTPSGYADTNLAEVIIPELADNDIELVVAGTNAFAADVPSTIASLSIGAKAVSQFAKVSVNGTELAGDGTEPVALAEGENIIEITVSAESGATKTYTLTITRNSVSKEALEALVEEINDNLLDAGWYTTKTWTAFEEAFDYAADVLLDDAATDDDFEIACAWLSEVYEGLRIRPALLSLLNRIEGADAIAENPASKDMYTEDSYFTFEQALERSNAILDNPAAYTDTEVYNLADALVAAIKGLISSENPYRTALEEMIDLAETLLDNSDGKIPVAVENLQGIVDDAKALLDEDPPATDAELIDMVDQLWEAIWQLYDKGDKTELEALRDRLAAVYEEDDYTADSWADFADAMAEAGRVLDDPNAIDDDIDDVITQLIDAEKGLALKKIVDRSALSKAIQDAKTIIANKGDYVASTILGLPALISSGDLLMGKADATQTEIDQATVKLREAIAKARLKPDKSPLLDALRQARAVSLSLFTAQSVSPLNTLVAEAQTVVSKPDEALAQNEINALAAQILDAIRKLVPLGAGGNAGTPSAGYADGSESAALAASNLAASDNTAGNSMAAQSGGSGSKGTIQDSPTPLADDSSASSQGFPMQYLLGGFALLLALNLLLWFLFAKRRKEREEKTTA